MKCTDILFVVLLMIYCVCCSKSTDTSELDNEDIYTTWVHSYEEQDTYYPQIFRPINYTEFGAGRF